MQEGMSLLMNLYPMKLNLLLKITYGATAN